MLAIFKEIDVFDYVNRVDTRTISSGPYSNFNYMPYWPVFTSVCLEMMRQSHNYYLSAIRYSNYDNKTVFIDLGSGAGKTPIMAAKLKKFDFSVGVEIDHSLHFRFQKNVDSLGLNSEILCHLGNVEDSNSISRLIDELHQRGFTRENTTYFLFNKNSYSKSVLNNSLKLLEKNFSSIIYMYQNPVHHETLLNRGFEEFGRDSKLNSAHKNYKYILYKKEVS